MLMNKAAKSTSACYAFEETCLNPHKRVVNHPRTTERLSVKTGNWHVSGKSFWYKCH